MMKQFGTAIILAGGMSSRMGFDKQLLEINGIRLVDYIIDKLYEVFDEIIVSTNKPEYYDREDVILVEDILDSKGPLTGIHAGLTKSKSKFSFVIGCDMPNINFEYINYLKERLDSNLHDGIITQRGDWIEPFYSFYSKNVVKDIEDNLKNNKQSIFSLIKNKNFLVVEEEKAREFSPNWEIFENLNTKEDLNYFKSKEKADS